MLLSWSWNHRDLYHDPVVWSHTGKSLNMPTFLTLRTIEQNDGSKAQRVEGKMHASPIPWDADWRKRLEGAVEPGDRQSAIRGTCRVLQRRYSQTEFTSSHHFKNSMTPSQRVRGRYRTETSTGHFGFVTRTQTLSFSAQIIAYMEYASRDYLRCGADFLCFKNSNIPNPM